MNDTLLQNLIHNQLLNPLNLDIELKASRKQKAVAGRILELTGRAKTGKGDSVLSRTERNRIPRKIRDGMDRKRRERAVKELRNVKLPY